MRLLKTERDWIGPEFQVKEAMTRMPFTVSPDVSIFEAQRLMRQLRVRHLPVLEREALVGIVSERDLIVAETFHGPGYLFVRDAMRSVPYTVAPETPLSEVLTTMLDKKIGSAIVRNSRGIVVGIFTNHDALHLLRALVLLGSRDYGESDFNADEPSVAPAA